jgi:NADH-quinone oxidoreductase subunit L
MEIILNLTWAIVLFPLLGVGAAFLAETPRRAAQVGVAFTGIALTLALIVLGYRLSHVVPSYENTQTFWQLQSTSVATADSRILPPEFLVLWGIRVDPLSLAFMATTLALSLVAQVYALAALRGDEGFRRFFWVVGVLTFGLLALASSPNLFQFWLGWEVVAVAGWMLAAHHWQRADTASSSTRMFVLLRVADLVLLGVLVAVFTKFGQAVSQLPAPPGQLTADPFSFSVLATQWHLGHLGLIAGTGVRTLVVLSVMVLVAASIRAAIGPFHLWLRDALDAPIAGIALLGLSALVPAALLLARLYPLLLETPHVLTVLALVGALGAVGGAALALAQHDLLRVGMFAVASQAGLILATFGVGGYSPALFVLLTASFLSVAYFLAAGNLSRMYRSRQLADIGGSRRRMPRTTLTIGGWALGISGLSLNTYSVVSATFRNATPVGGHVSSLTQVVVAIAAIATTALTALYAFRVYFAVSTGEPARRRGFDATRLREADPRLRGAALLALAGAAAATVVGIPGINSFMVGARKVPGLTFSHFVFYGAVRQQLALDPLALVIVALLGAGGAAAAWWLFAAPRRAASTSMRARFRRLGTVLAGPTPAERVAAVVPVGFVRAGSTLRSVEEQLLDPVTDAMGESVTIWGELLVRLRSPRIGVSLAAAFAVVAVLVAASILAATGHFPVTFQ